MHSGKRARLTILLLFGTLLLLNCRVWTPAPVGALPAISSLPEAAVTPDVQPTPIPTPTVFDQPVEVPAFQSEVSTHTDEPAGCLSGEAQAALVSTQDMLARADQLLDLKRPLVNRVVPASALTDFDLPAGDVGAVVLDVTDVQNEYAIQRMLNALLVSGFTAWLRAVPEMDRHILAIPLIDPERIGLVGEASPWTDYVRTYWVSPTSHPEQDPYLLPILKLPPCGWMVERGFAPQVSLDWWANYSMSAPNYAAAAEPYLAGTTQAAIHIARQIDWLYDGREGANTMCGPLSWEILDGAGTFPPGWGGWVLGPKSFWLASPRSNGRPWSLFPSDSYRLYQYKEPLGRFDFSQFPLFPGDFIYTYSHKDGFDHMLVVTEVDDEGNVYTVTNLVQQVPEEKITIERTLLLNLYDKQSGIARNQWALDSANGRTGHDGFDVFRWAWAEKNVLNQPVDYTVEPGDTLELIAVRWRTPREWIAQYNGIAVDAALQIGQLLVIPPNQ